MKKVFSGIVVPVFALFLMTAISCDDGSGSDKKTGSTEYLLNGSWWVDDVIGGEGEGYYFDGEGGGYDLSNEGSVVYINCDRSITYTYNGHDLVVNEPGSTSGYTTKTFTFVITGDTTATLSILGFDFTANLLDLTADCIQ